MASLLAAALLTVVVHNTASVPDETVASARAQVEQIFASANVPIRWATGINAGTFGIQVTLRRQPGGGPGAMAPSALGTTVGEDHRLGGSSFVFYERVIKFAHDHRRSVDAILAYAIAHEMGHVLLPAPAHTPTGLMKAEWSDDDIRHLANDRQLFTVGQALLIRSLIEARLSTK
jgi:hypothetical protein